LGIQIDGLYWFDFYYCERSGKQSTCTITSDIITHSINLDRIDLTVIPNDTIRAGDTALIIGKVIANGDSVLVEQSNKITWSLVTSGMRPGDTLFVLKNDSTSFTGTEIHRVGVIARYQDTSRTLIDTVWITIIPDDPYQIDIVRQSVSALTATQVTSGLNLLHRIPVDHDARYHKPFNVCLCGRAGLLWELYPAG